MKAKSLITKPDAVLSGLVLKWLKQEFERITKKAK